MYTTKQVTDWLYAVGICHVVTFIILGLATGLVRSFKHMH
jgi:hypothetical protein